MPRRLLLHAGGDGASARPAVIEHLRGARRAVMIPYAQSDHDHATARFGEWLAPHGIEITGVHACADPVASKSASEATAKSSRLDTVTLIGPISLVLGAYFRK